jgi:TPR repeat protein
MMPIIRSLAAVTTLMLCSSACVFSSAPLLPGEGHARLRALRKAAERDNGLAQAQLAVLYVEGAPGIERNPERAHHWFRKAAGQGCAASQLYLGLMHLSGDYVEKDLDLAGHWFRQAADQGRTEVRNRLLQVHTEELPLRLRVAYEWIRDPLGGAPGPARP